MSTKQLRQAITPTHILGSTGVAEGSDLGYQSIPNFAANIQPELRATQGEAQTGTGNDKFLTPLRVRDVFVGTVSQSGGVPTGAIIERGSNANGEYVRYADGTQICWSLANTFSTLALGAGEILGVGWTFPATFAGPVPAVNGVATPLSTGDFYGVIYVAGVGLASMTELVFRNGSQPQSITDIRATAIGRWF